VRSNYREDPALDVRRQRTTNFDFQQKIQMNVMAKIGDKIEFNTNYNTEATFDFENKLKLKYEGKEDEIVKLIEAGDVTLPLNSSLITGSQSLFGIKTQLQFGRTMVTSVFSQKSETRSITVQGGAQTTEFELKALDYEENRHFFLSHYFRNRYEQALERLPIVGSNINITKIEVWVTTRGAAVTENRNIVSFMDLGEAIPYNVGILPSGELQHLTTVPTIFCSSFPIRCALEISIRLRSTWPLIRWILCQDVILKKLKMPASLIKTNSPTTVNLGLSH
jgi:cell surface protein SprA